MALPKGFPGKVPPPPPGFTAERAIELDEALQTLDPKAVGLSGVAEKKSLKTTHYSWDGPQALEDEIRKLTGQKDLRYAEFVLIDWQETLSQVPEYESNMTTLPESPDANTVGKGRLEEMGEAEEKKSAQYKKDVQGNKEDVQTALDQKIKLAGAAKKELENKEVHVRVKNEAKLSKDQTDQIKVWKEQVAADPEGSFKAFEAEMTSRVGEYFPPAAISLAAANLVGSLQTGGQNSIEAAVIKDFAGKPEFSWASPLSEMRENQIKISKEIVSRAFQKEVGEYAFPDKVEVYDTPQADTVPVSAAFIPIAGAALLNTQKEIVGSTKPVLEDFLRSPLEVEMEKMKARGTQGTYSFTALNRSFSYTYFKPATVTTTWVQSGGAETIIYAAGVPKGSSVANILISEGVKFGVNKVTGAIAKQVVKKATGAEIGAQIGAALGIEGGPLAVVTGAIGGLIGFFADRINFKEVRKWSAGIVGAGAALIALPFVGLAGAIGIGLAGTTISLGFGASLGAITLGSIGTTAAAFVGAVFTATIGAIGIPILFTLIGFPTIVAIILFIINSGAYIVPPGGFGASGIAVSGIAIDLNCNSLDKSLNPGAYAAELITCALDKSGLNPLFARMIGNTGWQKLPSVLNSTAIGALESSAMVVGSWGGVSSQHLQCVGLVAATAGQAYGTSFNQMNACSYIGTNTGGYRYVSGTRGIGSGDFFIINGKNGCSSSTPGHIGVVISVDGVGITCADANEIGPGKVRVAHGCFVLSQITGYLTKR